MGGLPTSQAASAITERASQNRPAVRFVCVNVGPRYGMEYVAILADMICRNASQLPSWTIQCVTDRPDELPEGISAIPADQSIPPSYWSKVQLFSPDMPWERGERIVYLDLDVCITGRLEDLVERKGIAPDAGWPTYNSSVMVWDHGEHSQVWTRWGPDLIDRSPGPIVPMENLPADTPNGGDQEYLTELGGWDLLPAEWCVSYKWQAKAWPPAEAKVVIFHGDPKPADIETGWVPNVWRIGGYTSLPEMKGVNVTHEQIADNIRAAVKRDLEWFTGFGPHKDRAVLVGGAPSAKTRMDDIRWHQRNGAKVISVNNAWRMLGEAGITPHAHVMLDARAENAEFVRDAPAGVRYLVASQCHPDVFDALADREVVVWHNGFGDNSIIRDILAPWWDEGPDQRPCVLVPGGGTVGLRTLWLLALSGFRHIHVYGMDSSYASDGAHHAYAQPLNDGEATMEVALGNKRYRAARWMVRQASEFRETWLQLKVQGVTVHVHGDGLIPDMAKALRNEAKQGRAA